MKKSTVVVALIVIAGGLLAWAFVVHNHTPPPPPEPGFNGGITIESGKGGFSGKIQIDKNGGTLKIETR